MEIKMNQTTPVTIPDPILEALTLMREELERKITACQRLAWAAAIGWTIAFTAIAALIARSL